MQKRTGQAPRDGRADQAVAEAFSISRAQAARAIAEGRALLNGALLKKASAPVAMGAFLQLEVPEARETALEKQDIPVSILYQDEDLAVVVKPCGMVVHPAAGNESGTLVNALLFALDGLSGVGGVKRPGIVHRLDKDTSGLLLVAKNDRAHLSLSGQLKARSMDKRYLAVVEGEMKEESGVVDLPIERSKRDRKRMAVGAEGREAITEWTLLENLRGAALLEVRILTGRTHQIRVHMQSLHHPVAGDPIYGHKGRTKMNGAKKDRVKPPKSPQRLMLHAWSLAFDHPRTGERLRFTAPPPEAFTQAVQKLRLQPGKPLPYEALA